MARRSRRAWILCAGAAFQTVGSAPAWAQDEATPPDDQQTILVTGSRIARPNDDSASPIQTVTARDFVLTGVPNVEQTLNQLPQLLPGFTNTSNNPGTGAATLDLRGLGSVRTLILVNGRRWIASDAGETPEVDVNTIPAALIERVDIVTGGASAVYGSDAVTGVINFILNDDFRGVRLEARQNITEQGDGRVSSADLVAGTGFAGGRGRIVASAGWLDQAPVLQGARALSRVALQDGCAVPGTRGETGASTPVVGACVAPNVLALTAGGSGIIPGTRIFGRVLFPVSGTTRLIPNFPGLRFDPDGQPRPFLPQTDAYNFAPTNYLQVGLERWSANALASFEASPAFEPYAELSFILTRSPQQLAPVPATPGFFAGTVPVVSLNLDNPFLTAEAARILDLNYGIDAQGDRGFIGSPATGFSINPAFGGDADGLVRITPGIGSRLDLGPRRVRNRREAIRGLVGARGEIADGWDYDLYFSHSEVEHLADYENSGSALRLQQAILARRDPATGAIVCIDPSSGCAPANIFGANNLSPEAAEFISTDPLDVTRIEEQVGEASIRGAIPLLPAGPAGLAFGATWRRSSYDFVPDPSLFTGDDLGFQPGTAAGGSTRVWELFGEARVPLLAGLTAELGLRWSHYDTVGGVWTWKAMGEWIPLEGLRLRGGWQRAVRAPNARELFEEPSIAENGFLDPCSLGSGLTADPAIAAACLRDGVPAGQFGGIPFESFAPILSSGDPDVDAETARTLTLGAVATPRAIPGLSAAIDYYDIRIRGAIGTFGGGPVSVIFGCILGGADPTDPLCVAYDRAPDGTVQIVRLPTANLPEIRARGIDWQLSYSRDLASNLFGTAHRITLQLTGTRYFESSARLNENLVGIDCAGFFGSPCGNTIDGTATPRWKLFNQATWTAGVASLSLRHRFFSTTRDARIVAGARLGFPPPDLPEEGRELESRHYFDLAASFRLNRRFDLTLGVNNLTDRPPAITGFNQIQANTDPSLYDVLGRRYFAALSVQLR